MSLYTQLIQALAPVLRSQKDHDLAYLSDACDVVDLERRLRELDRRNGAANPGRAFDPNAL